MHARLRLSPLLERLAGAGALPSDDADERLRKATLLLTACLIALAGTIWAAIYAVLGEWLAAAFPAAYVVGSAAAIAHFLRTKRYRVFRAVQLGLVLLLPFGLQWSLGGFVASGAVMVWAVAAPFGALVFHGRRQAFGWLAAYLGLVALSAAIDPHLPAADLSEPVVLAFFALNIGSLSAVVFMLLLYFVRERERALGALELEHRLLVAEQERSERLLLNVLPREIAERLKVENGIIADGFDEVSVLFADIVGFTPLAERMAPQEVVGLLNELFSHFDELVERRSLEKIKTVGDGYMVAGGLPAPRADHADAVADLALAMRDAVPELPAARDCGLAVRIGIATGPVVAGVIGRRRFSYDLWGDTVNTASRMEAQGLPGAIQVSERVHDRLRAAFVLERRGVVEVKGKGAVPTFLLLGRR